MHQKKGKNILIYFCLLILVGSLNNVNLSKIKLINVKDINVSGLDEKNNLKILKKMQNLNLENIFIISTDEIQNIFESNSLVENYEIIKIYPSTLNVQIKKTKFLARTNINGKIFLIGSNGKLIENNFSNKKLPFIFGNPITDEFLKFEKIIKNSKIPYDKVRNLYYFQSKRWDLELENKIILKLPAYDIKNSLDLAFEFLNHKDLKNEKIIDLRIKNQIILHDRTI